MFDPDNLPLDAERAFRRYEAVRPRLPVAVLPKTYDSGQSLADLADDFDVFVLDAFGVLNIGGQPVPGAPERVRALQAAGKTIFVLTNGASFPPSTALGRYRSYGYELRADAVIASREAAATAMAGFSATTHWGAMAIPQSDLESLASSIALLEDDPADYDAADAFLMVSTIGWSFDRHALLLESLKRRSRPILVGNPDLIAPQEGGFSLEPGFYAHHLADETGIAPDFHGKPFASVFDLVKARLPAGTAPDRICMVGDTLHTDILGGAAAGWKTVLVTGHGLFKGYPVDDAIAQSGIVPDFVVETT